MGYFFNTPDDIADMLAAIGVGAIDELFETIPAELRMRRPLDLPPALTEIELTARMQELAAADRHAGNTVCFLGGGAYDHFIPAVVDQLASRGEFYTSYTPYQPEVSQGNLQAMFEYQSLICQLTGMDVSNASLYDGATATIEGVLMCRVAAKREGRVVVAGTVNPQYRRVLSTYLEPLGCEVAVVPRSGETIDVANAVSMLDERTACLVIQHPNFFGCLEEVRALVAACRERGIFVVQVFDPISLGLLSRPGDLGVDIAVAEGQALGNPLLFGGPYLGILACREAFMRRMPGRIAGQTIGEGDKRCWVLTLQTREQHIRRDKATSNVCTNQGLFALRAAIYLSLLGPQGLREVAENCTRKAHYAAERLVEAGWKRLGNAPFFKEFVVRDPDGAPDERIREGLERGLLVGVPLGSDDPDLADALLVAVTEKRTRQEIDRLAEVLAAHGAGV